MTTLATDVGGTKLAAVLIGADGQIHDRHELPTPTSQTPEASCNVLSALASPLQAHAQWVTIASTGIICDGNLLALDPHSLGGLLHLPLVKTLEQLTDLSTIAVNDVQATAWAEYQALEDDVTEAVFITVSTGVGGDVIGGGKPLTSPGGLAGHVGHTLADSHGPVYGCEHTGCAKAIASGCDITTITQGELAGAGAKAISTCAGQSDEQAQRLIHRSARTFTRLIADIKVIIGCQCVAVGGSIGLAEGYLTPVKTYLVQGPAASHVDLPTAYYRRDAGLFGVVLLVQGGKLR